MKKTLEKLFESINKQQRILSKVLKYKFRHYHQLANDVQHVDFARQMLFCKEFKTVQQILNKKEYNFLLNNSNIRRAYALIQQIEFNLEFGLCESWQYEKMYYSLDDIKIFAGKDAVVHALIFPHKNGVVDLILQAPAVFSDAKPKKSKKAFIYHPETEFVAYCTEKRCYVIRMVRCFEDYRDIRHAMLNTPQELCFSPLTNGRYLALQQELLDFKKKIMLCYEYRFNCLLPCKLGDIQLADFVRNQSKLSLADWDKIFRFLVKNENSISISQKHWNIVSLLEDFDAIFDDAYSIIQRLVQRYHNDDDDKENVELTPNAGGLAWAENDKIAFYFYKKDSGWVMEIYIRNSLNLEFMSIRDSVLYIVKFTKNLRDEPWLKELLSKQNSV